MWPMIGSLISGGASLLGSMFSSNTASDNSKANIAMQRETNQMSLEEAQRNRNFQEQMSSTAYQRSSADMQKAGLNPAMMFGSGSAASTPGGAQGNVQPPRQENRSPFEGLGHAASQAISSAVSMKTMDRMTDEMANLRVENKRLEEAVKLVHATTATERQRALSEKGRTEDIWTDIKQKRRDVPRQEWEAIKHIDLSHINDDIRRGANIGAWGGGKIQDTIAPVTNSAGSVLRLLPKRTTREHSDNRGYQSFDEMWSTRGFGR